MEHEKFIFIAHEPYGIGGYWGKGNTPEEAAENLQKSLGPKHMNVVEKYKFVSDEPFQLGKADCYVDDHGNICWQKCKKLLLK